MMTAYRWMTPTNGVPSAFLEQSVPPHIPASVMACAVFIYDSVGDAKTWRRTGGSGFLAAVPHDGYPGDMAQYIVTNSHVVANKPQVVVRLSKAFPDVGYEAVPIPKDHWIHHPDGDDVAVAPLNLRAELYDHTVIPLSWFMSRDDVTRQTFASGDEVFFVGRQVHLDGKRRNTPIARFGTVAMMNPEPIIQSKRAQFEQESIIIEARSLHGFSGSPVFVYRSAVLVDNAVARGWTAPGIEHLGDRPAVCDVLGSPLALLGIDWGHYNAQNVIVSPESHLSTQDKHDLFNAGMMMAVPAWKIESLLMSDGMRQMRDSELERVKQELAEAGEPAMDSLPTANDDEGRVSLDGVDPEDALRALLRTPPHGGQQ